MQAWLQGSAWRWSTAEERSCACRLTPRSMPWWSACGATDAASAPSERPLDRSRRSSTRFGPLLRCCHLPPWARTSASAAAPTDRHQRSAPHQPGPGQMGNRGIPRSLSSSEQQPNAGQRPPTLRPHRRLPPIRQPPTGPRPPTLRDPISPRSSATTCRPARTSRGRSRPSTTSRERRHPPRPSQRAPCAQPERLTPPATAVPTRIVGTTRTLGAARHDRPTCTAVPDGTPARHHAHSAGRRAVSSGSTAATSVPAPRHAGT